MFIGHRWIVISIILTTNVNIFQIIRMEKSVYCYIGSPEKFNHITLPKLEIGYFHLTLVFYSIDLWYYLMFHFSVYFFIFLHSFLSFSSFFSECFLSFHFSFHPFFQVSFIKLVYLTFRFLFVSLSAYFSSESWPNLNLNLWTLTLWCVMNIIQSDF